MDYEGQELHKDQFGEDFKWGISTAAFQTEGSCAADGKGPSVWDVFSARKGKIRNGHHANTACDFYNCYQKDIALIRRLNIPNFRFSVSWPRVLPSGVKTVNQKGIDFYNKVIDHCLENDIEPWLTLYHWDLPQALELKGGWTNRDIVSWFADYTELCARNYGDRVKHWMVLNEPMVFTGAGYFLGLHAPGRAGLSNFLPAIHHAVLSMGEGGRILKKLIPDAEVGTTFSCSYIEPFSQKPKDIAAATRADALLNRLFIEPVLGMGYPVSDVPVLKSLHKYHRPGDEEKMKFDFDFIGLQNYTREIVKYSLFTPYLHARLVKAEKRNVPLTSMRWEVYPPAMYHILKKFNDYPGIKKIYITENGAAFPDQLQDGKVEDSERLKYLQDHIAQVLKAKSEGCKVDGYFIWTLTDNFEWAEGYDPRFGIIYVDFSTQKRVIKSSGKWYARFLAG
ncbi:GH1 family beta-glucosidase [Arcticibacter tournemirensis]|uniref:Beta-glucosidase n=1 Tax=Arcticibacter tournemirensis TaxID=699437 RepID=A0A4V1KI69_9SPHI|nr:GH1 family beta-glucosidase [Arcticibacter tournemirensis]RXF69652.1 beta-glucosidase [Arcticibacter tournemirensis]